MSEPKSLGYSFDYRHRRREVALPVLQASVKYAHCSVHNRYNTDISSTELTLFGYAHFPFFQNIFFHGLSS